MRNRLRGRLWLTISLLLCAASNSAGCGKSETPPAGQATETAAASLPPASISAPRSDSEEEDAESEEAEDEQAAQVELKEGSPEWLIREATRLRLEAPPKTDDVDVLRASRKQRNETIVEHCQKAIAQVHDDQEKERLFTAAVHQLCEARLQLALAGERDHIDALYEDAEALFKRDPKSAAAAEAAHALVNLAYSSAQNETTERLKWIEEFCRQATHFASSFPAEERRALPLLFTAARSCELASLNPQAIAGFEMITLRFPNSPYAPRATAILRRLKLIGNPAQLSGPTIKREQVVLDDLLGKPILIVFFSTEAKPFVEGLPEFLESIRPLARQGLKVVGVSLDGDATAVKQFAVEHKLAWPVIFHPEPEKQGWNNPIVSYYGVLEIPAVWLIDQSGNVISTTLTMETVAGAAGKLLSTGEAADDADGDEPLAKKPTPSRPAARKPHKLEEEE